MTRISLPFLLIASTSVCTTTGFIPSPPRIITKSSITTFVERNPSRTSSVALEGAASNANERMPLVKGSSAALVTPMNTDGSVDVASLEKLLDFHIDAKTDNLCVLGTTAEASLLSMAERKLVLDTVVSKAKGIIPLLVGTGTIDPTKVRDMTLQAIDCGADASLIVTPYYIKPPQRGLVQHFIRMADLGLPVVVYNVPGRTRVDMTDESIAETATHENIVGLKDATGNTERVQTLTTLLQERNILNDDFLLFSGDDGSTLDFINKGGHGCISVTANVAPATMHSMVQSALSSRDGAASEDAASMNASLEALHTHLFCEANPIPVKWCLHRMGLMSSPYCRPPLVDLDPQYEDVLLQALTAAGIDTKATTTT